MVQQVSNQHLRGTEHFGSARNASMPNIRYDALTEDRFESHSAPEASHGQHASGSIVDSVLHFFTDNFKRAGHEIKSIFTDAFELPVVMWRRFRHKPPSGSPVVNSPFLAKHGYMSGDLTDESIDYVRYSNPKNNIFLAKHRDIFDSEI